MSEIQSVEGRPIKKGMSPGRRSAVGALLLLGIAIGLVLVGQLVRPPAIPLDHDLALIRTTGYIELAKSDGSASSLLVGVGVPQTATSIRWAPGGDFLALRTDKEVVVVDRDGVVAWRQPIQVRSANVVWNPDGSRIAIYDGTSAERGQRSAGATLDIFTTAGALEWTVPLPDGFGLVSGRGNLAWSPDGGSIAFTGGAELRDNGVQPTTLWLADVAAQTFRQVGETDAGAVDYGPAWSRDGTLYVARASPTGSGIWRVDPGAGSFSSFLRTAAALCPVVQGACVEANVDPLVPSPDGDSIAFRDPTSGLVMVDVKTGKVTKVGLPASLGDDHFVWSADAASVLYLRDIHGADAAASPDLVRFDRASGATSVIQPGIRSFDLIEVTP